MNKIQTPVADILIIDDIPNNLRLLSAMLLERGYKVRKALNGEWGLQAVETAPPDLILLDVMLPDYSGYEICKRLKESPKTYNIPVIFISALKDQMDKVLAFDLGAVDYITKPFQIQEVATRIDTHLTLHRQKLQMEMLSGKLDEEMQKRQQAEIAFLQLLKFWLNNSNN